MQKITPHLWFDKEAKEAAEFYISILSKNSKVKNVNTLHNTPSGSVDIVSFELAGQEFMAISAGPLFKFNFYVSVFRNAPSPQGESKVGDIFHYLKGQEADKEGTIAHASFTLDGQQFAAMDSAREHNFNFNEAISFMVNCNAQEEIDYYWG